MNDSNPVADHLRQIIGIEPTAAQKPKPDWRLFGRLGGLKYAAQNDVHASTAHARKARAKKWLLGHGCRVCGAYIAIPADLSDTEKARRAVALRKRHYVLLGSRSKKR